MKLFLFLFGLMGSAECFRISRQMTTFTNFRKLTNLKSSVQSEEELDLAEDNLLIERINSEILADSGVELDQLINPAKVVNLERDLVKLERQLSQTKDANVIAEIQETMAKKRSVLASEKRLVMRGWLKNLFVSQSVAAVIISLGLVYNAIPGYDVDLSVRVLGLWSWWLFIVPSLRARKPSNEEKDALNIAFLVTPLVSFGLPFITKDIAFIWWMNFVAVAGCYLYAYNFKGETTIDMDGEENSKILPQWVTRAIKALDYGTGQERGLRK